MRFRRRKMAPKITLLLLLVPVLIALVDFTSSAPSTPEAPILLTKQGKVKGAVGETREGRHYASFLGIPYADKPVRFQLAGPPPKWNGIREGTKFGSRCAQYRREIKEIVGSEDCLYLNVYTPEFPKQEQIKPKKLLPVLVYIHGGSFLFYSGEVVSPRYLLDQDVILVTFNYRIGALGFLNTEDRAITPNLGMKDQVAALEWVKENIQSFGGDPKRVTIVGNSAGSASVSYHVLSPLSKGLFSSAISQSGTALCPWAFVPSPAKVANNLGTKLNCPTKTTKELVDCLKSKPVKDIVEQQQKVLGTLNADPPVPFAPSAESNFVQTRKESADDFLPGDPATMLAEGNFNRVPYIIGINSADGLTFAAASILNNSKLMELIDKGFDDIAPAILAFGKAPNPKQVSQKVREYYFGKSKITPDSPQVLEKFIQLLSDRNFFQCTQNTALAIAKHSNVFPYFFTYDNGQSFLDHFGMTKAQEIKGIKHQDEIQYFTPTAFFPEISKASKSYSFSQQIVSLWTSFAESGKPTRTWPKATAWNPISAEQLKDSKKLQWYNIDSQTQYISAPFATRVQFWNELPLSSKSASATSENSKSSSTLAPLLAPSLVKAATSSKPDAPGQSIFTSTTTTTTTTKPTSPKPNTHTVQTSGSAGAGSFSHVFPNHDAVSISSDTPKTVTESLKPTPATLATTSKKPGLFSRIFSG